MNNNLINGQLTVGSNLTVSGNTLIQGTITFLSFINISNNMTLQNTTISSTLTVSGSTILYSNTTLNSNLNVNNNTILNGYVTLSSNLNVINNSILQGSATIISNLNVSGNSIYNGTTTYLSTLNISGSTIIQNNTSLMSQLSVGDNATFVKSVNISGNMTVSSPSILNTCSIYGYLSINNIQDFSTNEAAVKGGIPIWGIYRTGGIIKIRLDNISPTLTLLQISGNTNLTINQFTTYYEPGIIATDNVDLIPYIISIQSTDTGELVNTPIPLATTNIPLSIINTNNPTTYTIKYIATDTSGNYSNAYRTLIIRALIRSLLFNNVNIYQSILYGGIANDFNNNILGNGFRSGWCLSSNGLQSLGFKFTNSWQIILKGQITTNLQNMIEFSFDPSLFGWPNSGAQHSGRYVVEFGGPRAGGINYGWLQNPDMSTSVFSTNNNLMTVLKAGFYVQIKYSDNITLTFLDLNGNIIYTWISTAITYINNITPFVIYMDMDICNFNNGILYDITSGLTTTYLDFKSNFNIT